MDLEAMKNIDIQMVGSKTLKDIRDVKINTDLPKEERWKQFIEQIGNPYCFKCGKTIIKVKFADTQVTLEERLKAYYESL